MRTLLVLILGAAAACTSLGPTPASTMITARPAGRPSMEAQVGIAPGHYLSSAVVQDPKAAGIGQLSATFEPDREVGVRGLFLGGRLFGDHGDTPVEPVIGYRRALGDGAIAIGGMVYGTHAEATRDDAHYSANRGGAEVSADVRLFRQNKVLEAHVFGGGSVTALSVDGHYCIDANGEYGVQCPNPGDPPGNHVDAHASGAYPAATAGLSAEILRHRESWFHGARVAFMGAVGRMPRVVNARQTEGKTYASIGLSLSLGFGAGD